MSEDVKEPKTEQAQEQKELTAEELTALRKQKEELSKHYKEETKFLRLQADYEEQLTRIDVAKMTRLEIMIHKAQLMSPPNQDEQMGPRPPAAEEHEAPRNTTGKRPLKTD